MDDASSSHAGDMVLVVNTINRRTQSIASAEVEMFLRKHKLFRLVEQEHVEEKKRKPRKPAKKATKVIKEEKPVESSRKRKSPEGSIKSSPAPSEVDTRRRKSTKESQVEASVAAKPNPLIVIPLKEMHEIVRLFTSSPAGCVDWDMISQTATGGRIPAADVEYAANEFLPHVHYRPSIGLVVMERQSKIPSEYQRHRQTMKRLRQGLGLLLGELKSRLTGVTASAIPAPIDESLIGMDTTEVTTPDITEELPTQAPPSRRRNPATPAVNLNTYLSSLPVHVVEELKQRSQAAMSRFEKAETPTYAMRSAVLAKVDADASSLGATGRIRKRYETKAMRLAREAANGKQPSPTNQLSMVKEEVSAFEPPPFFHAAVRQFNE